MLLQGAGESILGGLGDSNWGVKLEYRAHDPGTARLTAYIVMMAVCSCWK